MSAAIEVKFFNTFILKKTMNAGNNPVWNGSLGIPEDKGGYERAGTTNVNNWAIEESRIRGGYNNTSVSLGAKAYIVEEEPRASLRINSLIYSGIFNSRTGINNTNVFSVGTDITKSLDPAHGSIQKLYAEDTNLNIFQELKVSRALIDKDAIYSAEGGGAVTSSSLVIGAIQPYKGAYGISQDPQSFAIYGYGKYFSDKNNNVILRLSQNGIEEISKFGMYDYFRDELNSIDTPRFPGTVLGGWDIHNKQYVVSTQPNNVNLRDDNDFNTLSFDESVKGWTSFYTYKPDHIFSIRNNFYTLKDGRLWLHYSNQTSTSRGNYYGTISPASIKFVFNPDVTKSKNFKTINYEGSNGWQVDKIESGLTGQDLQSSGSYSNLPDVAPLIYSYTQGRYDSAGNAYPNASSPPFYWAGFHRKENEYTANLINASLPKMGEITFGATMSGIKGYFATVTMSTDSVTNPGGEKELFSAGSEYVSTNGF